MATEVPAGTSNTTDGSCACAGGNGIADSTGTNANKEATGNESLPLSGYIVAGKMRLGSINVPNSNCHITPDETRQGCQNIMYFLEMTT
jgi:hypothetical protein